RESCASVPAALPGTGRSLPRSPHDPIGPDGSPRRFELTAPTRRRDFAWARLEVALGRFGWYASWSLDGKPLDGGPAVYVSWCRVPGHRKDPSERDESRRARARRPSLGFRTITRPGGHST